MTGTAEATSDPKLNDGERAGESDREAEAPTGSASRGPSTADSRPRDRRRPGPVPRTDQLGQIREEVAKDLTRVGMILSIPRPLTGLVLVNRAERAADALTMLAAQNPRVLRLLKLVAGASIYAELGAIVGEMVVAAGVEAGAVPIESPLTGSIRQEIGIVVELNQARAAQAEAQAQAQEPTAPAE